MNSRELRNLQEAYIDVYDNIMEKEDSPYEKASDAALDARYGYGRASGDKRSFGRAANRSSAAAASGSPPAVNKPAAVGNIKAFTLKCQTCGRTPRI